MSAKRDEILSRLFNVSGEIARIFTEQIDEQIEDYGKVKEVLDSVIFQLNSYLIGLESEGARDEFKILVKGALYALGDDAPHDSGT